MWHHPKSQCSIYKLLHQRSADNVYYAQDRSYYRYYVIPLLYSQWGNDYDNAGPEIRQRKNVAVLSLSVYVVMMIQAVCYWLKSVTIFDLSDLVVVDCALTGHNPRQTSCYNKRCILLRRHFRAFWKRTGTVSGSLLIYTAWFTSLNDHFQTFFRQCQLVWRCIWSCYCANTARITDLFEFPSVQPFHWLVVGHTQSAHCLLWWAIFCKMRYILYTEFVWYLYY